MLTHFLIDRIVILECAIHYIMPKHRVELPPALEYMTNLLDNGGAGLRAGVFMRTFDVFCLPSEACTLEKEKKFAS